MTCKSDFGYIYNDIKSILIQILNKKSFVSDKANSHIAKCEKDQYRLQMN